MDVGEYEITQGDLEATDNYKLDKFTGAKLTITKADSSVASAPKAKTGLVESGSAQALVEKGTADGGTMLYSLESRGQVP